MTKYQKIDLYRSAVKSTHKRLLMMNTIEFPDLCLRVLAEYQRLNKCLLELENDI